MLEWDTTVPSFIITGFPLAWFITDDLKDTSLSVACPSFNVGSAKTIYFLPGTLGPFPAKLTPTSIRAVPSSFIITGRFFTSVAFDKSGEKLSLNAPSSFTSYTLIWLGLVNL